MITPAYAAPAQGGFDFLSLLPMVLIFGVFYFLIIRPQSIKHKKHQESLSQLRRGDKIMLGGGILGTISKVVDEKHLLVEIADDVKITVLKNAVTNILNKQEDLVSDKK